MAKAKSKEKPDTQAIVHVDIVSDVICPWCWLGAAYFHKAAEQHDGKIQLHWRPYMLDPAVPPQGVPYKTYMKNKFGEAGPGSKWTAMREHLESAGSEVGIAFNFSGIKMRPNTLNAHRLLRWAQGQNKGSAMSDALFRASLGVSGVPTFIYNGQFAVQGAQPVEKHLRALEEASKLSAHT